MREADMRPYNLMIGHLKLSVADARPFFPYVEIVAKVLKSDGITVRNPTLHHILMGVNKTERAKLQTSLEDALKKPIKSDNVASEIYFAPVVMNLWRKLLTPHG